MCFAEMVCRHNAAACLSTVSMNKVELSRARRTQSKRRMTITRERALRRIGATSLALLVRVMPHSSTDEHTSILWLLLLDDLLVPQVHPVMIILLAHPFQLVLVVACHLHVGTRRSMRDLWAIRPGLVLHRLLNSYDILIIIRRISIPRLRMGHVVIMTGPGSRRRSIEEG